TGNFDITFAVKCGPNEYGGSGTVSNWRLSVGNNIWTGISPNNVDGIIAANAACTVFLYAVSLTEGVATTDVLWEGTSTSQHDLVVWGTPYTGPNAHFDVTVRGLDVTVSSTSTGGTAPFADTWNWGDGSPDDTGA